MDQPTIKSNIITSLIWKLMERGGTQGIQFIVSLFLARLLLPKQYGMIAIVAVFISLASVFVQSGFNTALIQKKDVDNVDFSSVLYLSLGVAAILYFVIYFAVPYIAVFYDNDLLTPVLRVLSITLFIGAFNSIQNAYVTKHMLFKRLFYSSLGAIVISGTVGIIAAYNNFGVWALVFQQLTNQLFTAILLWFTVKWRPHLVFSFKKVKRLFSFGSKLLASALLDTLYRDIRTLIIGRVYSPAMLGYYNRGQQFPKLIVSNINGSISSVMLPTLSFHQENRKRVKDMMRRAIVTSALLMFPAMIGLAVIAEPMVKLVLTEKWLPVVPFLRIFCISYSIWPIHTANLQAINALGRSDIFLKLEVIKKVLGIIILAISIPFGIYAIALGQLISGLLSSFINAYPNKKLLNYSYLEQMTDVLPSIGISLIMGGIVYLFNYLNTDDWKILIIQIISGVIIYIGLAKLFKIESFSYLIVTIKDIYKVRNKTSK